MSAKDGVALTLEVMKNVGRIRKLEEKLLLDLFQRTGYSVSRSGYFRDRSGCFYVDRCGTAMRYNKKKLDFGWIELATLPAWEVFCRQVLALLARLDQEEKEAKRMDKLHALYRPGGLGYLFAKANFEARSMTSSFDVEPKNNQKE